MTRPIHLIVVEGLLEEPISRKLLTGLGLDLSGVLTVTKGGQGAFWRDVARYNQAAELGPVFALADLETAACFGVLLGRYLRAGKHPDYLLRLAVRMVESWLLADVATLASFLQVAATHLPPNPDLETSPKQTLVNLARRSRSRSIRADLVPEPGSKGVVGKNYTARMSDYVTSRWQPLTAVSRSPSLSRAVAAIRRACELDA